MARCPLCRAELAGAEICRRCRADLTAVNALARKSRALSDAAIHRLAEGELASARHLAGRAMLLHATPENRALCHFLWHVGDPHTTTALTLDDSAALTSVSFAAPPG